MALARLTYTPIPFYLSLPLGELMEYMDEAVAMMQQKADRPLPQPAKRPVRKARRR
ncbi:hypothetical protein ACE6ED_13375 [Paenibacillus sp. CN-4]|uniref:hypothetical protein n=1 Tax=Paenibacillus nanchangensis TaxID=3348343 RepID=UPI00397C505D